MHWDAIVVGSGFGGSVTSLRLAQSGMNVLVLERGPWWGPKLDGDVDAPRQAYPRGWGMLGAVRNVNWARGERPRHFELNPRGLLEVHVHPNQLTWTASGVGGGSLIYTDILMRPPTTFYEALPEEISESELEPHFERVSQMLRARPLPEEKRREFVRPRQMAEAAERVGREVIYPPVAVNFDEQPDGNAAGLRQPPCIACGECFVGCPTGAKTTLDRTYLPAAVQAGAQIRDLSEVTAVARHDHGYAVHYRDRQRGDWRVEHAPRLVMAAGGLNTLRLLGEAQHRHGSLDLPPALGQRYSPNGDMMAIAWGEPSPEGALGPSYPVLIEGRADTDGAQNVYGEVGFPAAVLGDGPIADKLRSAYIFFAIGQDGMQAPIEAGPDGIRLSASREQSPDYYAATEAMMDTLMDAYAPTHRAANLPGGPGSSYLTSVHPMGGAAIGRGPDDGVVDHRGEVFGNPGLYVADGSLYPAAPGVPPSLTIAALAERQAELLATRSSEQLPAERVSVQVPAALAARGAITVRPHDLAKLTDGALERAFDAARAPSIADVQGELSGAMLSLAGMEALPVPLARLLRGVLAAPIFPWRAKRIVGRRGRNLWGLGDGQIAFGEFDIRRGTAWDDGHEVLVVDYDVDANPATLRHLRGELGELDPGLLLGRFGWRSPEATHLVGFFGLGAN